MIATPAKQIWATYRGAEEVYHGPMPDWIDAALETDPKALEKELAKYLPA